MALYLEFKSIDFYLDTPLFLNNLANVFLEHSVIFHHFRFETSVIPVPYSWFPIFEFFLLYFISSLPGCHQLCVYWITFLFHAYCFSSNAFQCFVDFHFVFPTAIRAL